MAAAAAAAAAVVAAAGVACAPPAATRTATTTTATVVAAPPARGVFALVRGADTLGVERFTRSADRLEAEFSAGAGPLFRYEAQLRPDGGVARLAVTPLGSAAAGGAQAGTVTFAGDSVTLTQGAGTAAPVRRAAPAGTVVYVNPSPSLMEQIVRRGRALGGRPGAAAAAVPVLVAASGGDVTSARVTFPAADSARLELAGVTVLLQLDANGAVTGGSVPAQRLTLVRRATP